MKKERKESLSTWDACSPGGLYRIGMRAHGYRPGRLYACTLRDPEEILDPSLTGLARWLRRWASARDVYCDSQTGDPEILASPSFVFLGSLNVEIQPGPRAEPRKEIFYVVLFPHLGSHRSFLIMQSDRYHDHAGERFLLTAGFERISPE